MRMQVLVVWDSLGRPHWFKADRIEKWSFQHAPREVVIWLKDDPEAPSAVYFQPVGVYIDDMNINPEQEGRQAPGDFDGG